MEFKCTYCNYSSCDKSNFLKHNKSQKHKEKVNESSNISQKYPIDIPNDSSFKCPFCNLTFTKSCNLSRHKNTCLEKKDLENNHKQEIDKLANKVNDLEGKLSNKDELLKPFTALSNDEIIQMKSVLQKLLTKLEE